jgi:hypothetical protein
VNNMSPTTLMTLRAALRYWSTIHDWENRLFKIARNTAKYGDCFFRRGKDNRSKWTFIHPKMVVGAVVDQQDVTKILAYQIKIDIAQPMNSVGQIPVGQQYDSEIVPAHEIVRFSLNDDMSHVAPFGESILAPVYRAHKQKEMLEDAIIIYRTVRAPERRVFYIDVGKMPPAMTKKYLEQIKNEIRQKKIPSSNGGQTNVDSVYNAQSMSEDFYFAQRADGKGSRVETLPGGAGLGELADLDHFLNKVFRGLRIPLSWMNEQQGGALFNDGKVGQAYIQELIFGKYVQRLQGYIDRVMDVEFKKYLRDNNILIDESMYKLRLPEPTNFAKFRQAEIDQSTLNTYAAAADIPHMSKRFGLARFAQWSEDDILANEKQLCEERGIPDDAPNRMQLIYGDPSATPADFSMPGGGGGGGGMGAPIPGGGLGDPGAGDALDDPAGGTGTKGDKDTSTTDLASKQNTQSTPGAGAKPGAPAR